MTPRELVDAHLPLVYAIAAGVRRAMPYADMDELISNGNIGLCEAAERFEEGHGATFASFAFHRVRGAMVDGVRREITCQRGRSDLAPLKEEAQEERLSPEERVDTGRQLAAVRVALESLSESERAVVVAVDLQSKTLDEAGELIGVKKSWVSRLRTGALEQIRRLCLPVSDVIQSIVAPVQVPVAAAVVPVPARKLRVLGAVASLLRRVGRAVVAPLLSRLTTAVEVTVRPPLAVMVIPRPAAPPGERAGPFPEWVPRPPGVRGERLEDAGREMGWSKGWASRVRARALGTLKAQLS